MACAFSSSSFLHYPGAFFPRRRSRRSGGNGFAQGSEIPRRFKNCKNNKKAHAPFFNLNCTSFVMSARTWLNSSSLAHSLSLAGLNGKLGRRLSLPATCAFSYPTRQNQARARLTEARGLRIKNPVISHLRLEQQFSSLGLEPG